MEALAIRLEAIATSSKKPVGGDHCYQVEGHYYASRWRPSLLRLEAITTSSKKLVGGGHRY